jgi:hypothetical protein
VSAQTLHPLADDYLKRLRRAGRGLPRARLNELTSEIEAHLSEAIDPGAADAHALTVLEQLGPPEEIIAAERHDSPPPPDRRGTREWAAIILLLFGGFAFGIGWLIGLILLWSSRVWTTGDKLIGTLIWPGGFPFVLVAGLILVSSSSNSSGGLCAHPVSGPDHCTSIASAPGPQILPIVVFALVLLAPFAVAVYLARRAQI